MTIWERTFRAAVRRAPGPELVALHGSAAPRWDRESTHTQPQTRPTPTTNTPSKRLVTSPSRPQPRKNPLPPGPVAYLNQQRQDTLGNQREPPLNTFTTTFTNRLKKTTHQSDHQIPHTANQTVPF